MLLGDDPPLLLDVRSSDQRSIVRFDHDRWIPFDQLSARTGELSRSDRFIVYCHFGGTAQRAAELLRQEGFDNVAVLEGGIDDYARIVDPTLPRYHEPPSDSWILQQFPNLSTGCLTYLIRDRASDDGIIIDPGREISPYLAALKKHRLRLVGIVETHTHADHLSGHAELHQRTSAPIFLSRHSAAQYPHRSLAEGEAVSLGSSELNVWETPGHTSDHLSLQLDGAVFTGDTLLPGSCGRTDLGDGDPLKLWESLTSKLLTLPDDTELYAAHFGQLHGLPQPWRYVSTIGFERRTNEALLQPDQRSFVTYMTDGWPDRPANFDIIVRKNLTI